MTGLVYTVLSVLWIYFFGWVFLGGKVFSKFIPKSALAARLLGSDPDPCRQILRRPF